MLLLDSIYETRVGYPVYYQNGMPSTPPYNHPYDLYQSSMAGTFSTGITKSELRFAAPEQSTPLLYQSPLVYPQFPTPPLSVSPGPLRYNSPSPPIQQTQQRSGDSFQIKRLLDLDNSNAEHHQDKHLAMRTASVIMKIEDQRVFQVDSTTTSVLSDEHSSFQDQHHLKHRQVNNKSGTESTLAPSESLFICKWEKCYKVFCHLNDLAGHVTQSHGSAPIGSINYYCKWEGCSRTDRGFNARYKMLVHIRTHTKEKPHQCPECHKCFSRAENLKIHIRSHSGEKPYVCPVEGCHKAYSNSSDRFKHTRTHSMTKPYQCKVPGCNKRYTDPSSLRKHVKTYKHKPQPQEEEQERITSTSDEIDEASTQVLYNKEQFPCCSSIDQRMTDLDIQDRSPCYCTRDMRSLSTLDNYEERLKMYRLGAIFNVNPTNCDVLVSSSNVAMDLESPLDLSTGPPRNKYNHHI